MKRLFDSCGLSDLFEPENQHILSSLLIDTVETYLIDTTNFAKTVLNKCQNLEHINFLKSFRTEPFSEKLLV